MNDTVLVYGLLWFIAFLFSTTVHEAMHALAALRGGDPTAYLGGQVSLSPLPHIRREPIGMLVVPLLTVSPTAGRSDGRAHPTIRCGRRAIRGVRQAWPRPVPPVTW